MGRRAADLATPVPVLGVPALVGVRGWKSTGGDRTGGALLHAWGLHCSVGVQTSPGISRPVTQHSVQLTDLTLSTPSDNITQTSNSYITKETEYKEILLVTKSDKEKRAILKQKSGESKTKKEVTFKALGGEVSEDVACSQRNVSGTYCYARAIKTNPHFAGNGNIVRPKLKSAARYTNGSVVDSEAIGGISVDNDEAVSARGATSRGRDQTRQQGHYAEQSGKTLSLSAARPFVVPQKICSHCGGKQSVTAAATLGDKSPTSDVCPIKSALTSLSAATEFHMHHMDRNRDIKPDQPQIPESTNRDTTVKPQILHFNEEVNFKKTPHPACPVHSTHRNLVTLSHALPVGDSASTNPTTILHAKTITVTKATIETRQDDASLKSFTKPSLDSKIPRPTSLMLTPQMATATKPNKPHSHTYPRPLKASQCGSSQDNTPKNVCESAHAAPENTPRSHSHTNIKETTNTSNTNTHTKATATESLSAEVNVQHETLHSMHRAQANNATNTNESSQVAHKLFTSAAMSTEPFHVLKTSGQTLPSGPAHTSPDPVHKPQEKLCSKVKFNPTACPTFAKTPKHTSAPQLNTVVPQSTLHYHVAPDQTSTKHNAKPVVAQISLIQPNSSNSEPTLHAGTTFINTPSATKSSDSHAKLPSSAALISTSTCNHTVFQNAALRNSSIIHEDSSATVGSSASTLTKRNVCVSSTALLKSADATQQELCHIKVPNANASVHERNIRSQSTDANGECSVSNQRKNFKTSSSQPLDVSKSHSRCRDARTHNPNSTMNPNTGSYTDTNKCNGNLINELAVHESQDHGNSNISQVTNLQNYISLIKSSSSCLQGCINTEQQRLAHYQGYAATEHKGHCGPCPPVKTTQETDSKTQQCALGVSARHANVKPKSNADNQPHCNYSSSSVMAPKNCFSLSSANTSAHVDPISQSLIHQNFILHTLTQPEVHTGPELSSTAPCTFKSEGELSVHTDPECNSIPSSSTMHLASRPRLQSCEAEAIVRPDSKFSPAPPQPCPDDTSLAHSHPADAVLLLPPSPQCCKSAALQQRLETVEASLAANKDRITTLLNIIHDLETCHTPIDG